MGRHHLLPSGSLQQAPVPTSSTRGTDTRSKRGYNSIICEKVTTPKTYKNEKTVLTSLISVSASLVAEVGPGACSRLPDGRDRCLPTGG